MKQKQIKIIFCLVILSVIGLWFSLNKQTNYLQVYFLDIGQGDAILIRTPDNQNILVDGGPDNKLLGELGEVLPWWDRQIDYLVISHYHADHLVGLIELLNHYQVKEILTTAHEPKDDFLFQIWQQKLQEQKIIPKFVTVGATWQLADNLKWQILSADSNNENYNDNSLVFRLSFGEIDFLFTGDLSGQIEPRLLTSGYELSSEILKVGHHGSKYSSSLDFLETIAPKVCLIQVGVDNKFGHPHQEALDLLDKVGCQVLRNDLQGRIVVWSDGQEYWVKSE